MRNRLKDIIHFWYGTADEHMGAFAAQSAFFLFLSFFPLVSIIITIPQFLPISQEEIINIVLEVIPSRFEADVSGVVDEIYSGSRNSITIFSAIVAIWSASKGLMAIRNGLNEVYRSRESRNYVIVRGISSIYTVLLMLLILALVPLNMFGTQIAEFFMSKFPNIQDVTMLILGVRTSATFVLLFLMFWLLYTLVPTRRTRFREQVPGALFGAGMWILITKIYSLYIDNYASRSYMYGSLTTVILLMFWLYFVIYMMFLGAQINEYRSQCRQKAQEYELKKYRDGQDEVWDDDLDLADIAPPIRHDYASSSVQEDVERGVNENIQKYMKKKLKEEGAAAQEKVVSIRDARKKRKQAAEAGKKAKVGDGAKDKKSLKVVPDEVKVTDDFDDYWDE